MAAYLRGRLRSWFLVLVLSETGNDLYLKGNWYFRLEMNEIGKLKCIDELWLLSLQFD